MKKINFRLYLVLIVTCFAIYFTYGNIMLFLQKNDNISDINNTQVSKQNLNEINKSIESENPYKINLGLDLSGGVHLLLKVDFNNYFQEKYKSISSNLKKQLRKYNFKYYENNNNKKDEIIMQIKLNNNNIKNFEAKIQEIVKNIDLNLNVSFNEEHDILSDENDKKNNKLNNNYILQNDKINEQDNSSNRALVNNNINNLLDNNSIKNNNSIKIIKIYYDETYKNQLFNNIIEQSISTLRNRIDVTGTKEPILQQQGRDKIILEMPGLKSSDSLKNAIKKTAKLTFHIVENEKKQGNIELFTQNNQKLIIKEEAELTGQEIEDAKVSFDEYSKPNITFKLNTKGAKLFGEITQNNIGKRLAIVLDNTIITAPTINTAIKEGSGIITGNFTIEEANELALFLKSGSLIVKLNIIEERIIGPTLGEQSIKDAKIAGLVAIILVGFSMLFYYGIFGLFANISLILSLLYMFAMLSIFNATLTMPGIAGIILTIGMAVDANILIYERIKEEFKKGQSLIYATKVGFHTAFDTIMDANITTLIIALILYIYGTGPIRGFAVTLSIGIIASMFSAIIVTKLIIDSWLKYNKKATIKI
ncbi:MAG: protein translocase subunit SecD [Rickettsiales bacterium]